jgi:hypothetical protein
LSSIPEVSDVCSMTDCLFQPIYSMFTKVFSSSGSLSSSVEFAVSSTVDDSLVFQNTVDLNVSSSIVDNFAFDGCSL